MRARWALLAWAAATGCVGDLDDVWQLDHDRIVAIRMTPPSIPVGATSVIDALMAHRGAVTDVEAPVAAEVSPLAAQSLQGVSVALVGSAWTVTAPDEATLDAARTELMLDAGAPVPLEVGAAFGDPASPLLATKVVYLGDSADNPTLTNTMIDGAPAPAAGSAILIPTDTDVPLSTDAGSDDMINWLTSCGTMHDDDEIVAFVHVQPKDPMTGQLALVRRDINGGVAFETWPIATALGLSGSGSGNAE